MFNSQTGKGNHDDRNMALESKKILYNTVLSQTLSSCGKFLFAGNNFGDVFVLSVRQIHSNDDNEYKCSQIASLEPIQVVNTGANAYINALAFHRNFLIVGSVGAITGYTWDDDKLILTKRAWEIKAPFALDIAEASDINCFFLDKNSDCLYVGCSDNNIHQINLEYGKICRTFRGHTDYIHCLSGVENRLFSASEDGNILFYDVREDNSTDKIEPHRIKEICRAEYGIWQGAVAVTDDWLICGGGPRGAMFHLRSKECTNVFSFPGRIHCAGFLDDMIFLSGEHSHLQEYGFNGEVMAEVPVSGPAAYSVCFQTDPLKIMSIGGASNSLDICTNYNYRDTVIKLYKLSRRHK